MAAGASTRAAPSRPASKPSAKPDGRRFRVPSDNQVLRQHGDRQNAAYAKAYQDGKAGRPAPGPEEPDDVHAAWEAGREELEAPEDTPTASPAAPPPARSSGGGSGPKIEMVDDGANFAVGMIAYALFINYVRYGWPGVTGWLSAKFINKVNPALTPTKAGQ